MSSSFDTDLKTITESLIPFLVLHRIKLEGNEKTTPTVIKNYVNSLATRLAFNKSYNEDEKTFLYNSKLFRILDQYRGTLINDYSLTKEGEATYKKWHSEIKNFIITLEEEVLNDFK